MVDDDYFGIKIKDKFRFLESDSLETAEFVTKQNILSNKVFEKAQHSQKTTEALKRYADYDRCSLPNFYRNNQWYAEFRCGLKERSSIVKFDNFKNEHTVFFDIDELAEKEGGKLLNLNTYTFSKCGKYFSYLKTYNGSDFGVVVTTLTSDPHSPIDLPINNVGHTSLQFTGDSLGFFYTRKKNMSQSASPEDIDPNAQGNTQLFYHLIGTDPSTDRLIFEEDLPKRFYSYLSNDKTHLIVHVFNIDYYKQKVMIAKLEDVMKAATPNDQTIYTVLPKEFDIDLSYIADFGSTFYFSSTTDAPNIKVLSIDIKSRNLEYSLVIKEDPEELLKHIVDSSTHLVLFYAKDLAYKIKIYSLPTFTQLPLEIPIQDDLLSITLPRGQNTVFFQTSSPIAPWNSFYIDLEPPSSLDATLYKTPILENHDASLLEVIRTHYPSKDGTMIPVVITKLKDVKLDGNNPAWVYGYGGFNVTIPDIFKEDILTFVKHYRGVYVSTHLRGGGEFGKRWHDAGRLQNKEKVFEDFEAAVRFVCKEGYTRSELVTINGGSNGGLLVAACVNRFPELFGCAISQVPVADMLRFDKFTCGAGWIADYGCATKSLEEFKTLFSYSPIHNVKKPLDGTPYPAMMIMTADHDDRVVPMHSYKLAAVLQETLPGNINPLVLKVEVNAGHGAGMGFSVALRQKVAKFAFMEVCLSLEYFE